MLTQAPDRILMIRPATFGFNPLTATSNTFQKQDMDLAPELIRSQGRMEFDLFVAKLTAAEIEVILIEDTPEPVTPDAVFPNNWISFHHDGTVVLYPMMAQNRRLERREDILLLLQKEYHCQIKNIIDLSIYEQADRFLEGTGSMVLDYKNKLAYSNLSPRTDESVLDRFCQETGFEKVVFHSVDENGQDIYHANVLMCIGSGFVAICLESIVDEAERINIMHRIESTGKEIIGISHHQMNNFAGNMLEVNNRKGERILVMSDSAYRSLGKETEKRLRHHATLLYAPLDTIEKYGGGSARCMMAGVFLPRA